MLKAFEKHISENFPELKRERFVLACSGGVDSVVLSHLCKAIDLDFALAHCNFQLRGADSDADEEFVQNIATKYKVKLFTTNFNTESYKNLHKVSVQMAARDLRYAWFAEIMHQNNIKTLVTAHHADDNLETFLINLSRGTGIEGLTGIPSKTDFIARPLLPFTRKELESYAKTNQIEWRDDKSNAETKYLRNKIRHDIVPLLKQLHPTFLENFNLTLSHLQNTASMVQGHVAKIKPTLVEEKNGVHVIDIEALQDLHPLKTYLHELFKQYGFTAWADIKDLLTASSGKEVRSKTHRLVKDRNTLLLTKLESPKVQYYQIQEGACELSHPVRLQIEEVSQMGAQSADVIYVDKKTLKYPLGVRKWKNGDYFYPFGMQGKKKLSKYFKDEKVDVIAKEKQWLLCSNDEIVWVLGRRADNRFKVTGETDRIIKISFK